MMHLETVGSQNRPPEHCLDGCRWFFDIHCRVDLAEMWKVTMENIWSVPGVNVVVVVVDVVVVVVVVVVDVVVLIMLLSYSFSCAMLPPIWLYSPCLTLDDAYPSCWMPASSFTFLVCHSLPGSFTRTQHCKGFQIDSYSNSCQLSLNQSKTTTSSIGTAYNCCSSLAMKRNLPW